MRIATSACCGPNLPSPSSESPGAPLRRRAAGGRAAAESYFGLWRDHEPHGHGMFRWFDGDMYFGEWSGGLFEGYGVYQYGPLGAYAYDRSAAPRAAPRRGISAGHALPQLLGSPPQP